MVPRIIVPPAGELISLEEARAHLRIIATGSPPEDPRDAMIAACLSAAREWAEGFTGRSLAPQELEIALDAFPCWAFAMPRPPVVSIVSIVYVDSDGVTQLLDPSQYQLDQYADPPLLLPADGASWPTTSATAHNPVIVRYEAGYSLPGSPQLSPTLPPSVQAAILLVLGDLFENAEDSSELSLTTIPRGAEVLLRRYRLESALA